MGEIEAKEIAMKEGMSCLADHFVELDPISGLNINPAPQYPCLMEDNEKL